MELAWWCVWDLSVAVSWNRGWHWVQAELCFAIGLSWSLIGELCIEWHERQDICRGLVLAIAGDLVAG